MIKTQNINTKNKYIILLLIKTLMETKLSKNTKCIPPMYSLVFHQCAMMINL